MDRLDDGNGRASAFRLSITWGSLTGHGSRFGVAHRRDLPQRADEPRAFLLDAENCRGDLLGDPVPHREEGFAPSRLYSTFGSNWA